MVITDNNKHAKLPFTIFLRRGMAGSKTVISVYLQLCDLSMLCCDGTQQRRIKLFGAPRQ